MNCTWRVIAILVLVVVVSGCFVPNRRSKDGVLIPLRGLGDHLPKNGVIPQDTDGPIYYDSLYVDGIQDILGYKARYYLRFWKDGRVLFRLKPINQLDDADMHKLFSIHDGNIGDDVIASKIPESSAFYTKVGRWNIVGKEIYIEWFDFTADGPNFHLRAGCLTSDGFTINRSCYVGTLFPKWKMHPTSTKYVRCYVGEMKGTPTW